MIIQSKQLGLFFSLNILIAGFCWKAVLRSNVVFEALYLSFIINIYRPHLPYNLKLSGLINAILPSTRRHMQPQRGDAFGFPHCYSELHFQLKGRCHTCSHDWTRQLCTGCTEGFDWPWQLPTPSLVLVLAKCVCVCALSVRSPLYHTALMLLSWCLSR